MVYRLHMTPINMLRCANLEAVLKGKLEKYFDKQPRLLPPV